MQAHKEAVTILDTDVAPRSLITVRSAGMKKFMTHAFGLCDAFNDPKKSKSLRNTRRRGEIILLRTGRKKRSVSCPGGIALPPQ